MVKIHCKWFKSSYLCFSNNKDSLVCREKTTIKYYY